MIKLTKLTLKNFKVFGGEPYTINFGKDRLVLLDGPNGYGKTSVFDAIELGVTGGLTRLVSLDARQNPADVVVAHEKASDVEITLEFTGEEGDKRVFQRKLKRNFPNASKKISKFNELWDLCEITDDVSIPSSQIVLDQLFDSKDFRRDFLLFHYIEQEETSRFLKSKNEAQRAEELAQLFGNTREADQRLAMLKGIYKRIGQSNTRTGEELEEIKKLHNIDDKAILSSDVTCDHFYILPWHTDSKDSPFWDVLFKDGLDHKVFNNALGEIANIKKFVTYHEYFLSVRSYEMALQERDVLENYLAYFNFTDDYETYVTRGRNYQAIERSSQVFKSGDWKRISDFEGLDSTFKILGLNNSEQFKADLKSLIDEENKAHGLSTIFSEILKHHSSMENFLSDTKDDSECLFCGHDYQSHDSLSDAVEKHGDFLRSELSGRDKMLVTSRDAFNKLHLSSLIQACSNYLEQEIDFKSSDLNSLSHALSLKDRFLNLRKWLKSQSIGHDDLLAAKFPVNGGQDKTIESTNLLCDRIRAVIPTPPEGYYEVNTNGLFERLYRDYFQRKVEYLAKVDIALLDKKEDYIKNVYFTSQKEIFDKIKSLKNQKESLVQALTDVEGLIKIMTTKIKQYRKTLITDIEIPFYIYSGKILQSHQAGLGYGVFIKDPKGGDELKNVRLVSNWESDHDVLNTMSSGQISAVVIALTLALHKVYAKRFSTILIDDPVQTMDEINMSSLVEVLRNDFKDKQVVLSTHEDKVSRYFTYKYMKYDESVKIVNLMQRKEYMPSNKFVYRA